MRKGNKIHKIKLILIKKMHKIPSSISLEKYLTRANQNMTDDLMNHPHMIWHQSQLSLI